MPTPSQLSALRQIVLEQFHSTEKPAARSRAEKFLNSGIIGSESFPDVAIEKTGIWSTTGARSHDRYLHGFIFLNDWFGTILSDADTRRAACSAALELVKSWSRINYDPASTAGMAYHDETTAQRLINLLRLDTFLAGADPDESNEFLRPLLDQTAFLLTNPTFHATGNNHGMFQDLALAYYSILAEWAPLQDRDEYLSLALNRLKEYFSSCFTSEGVHTENTPTYHVMVARYLSVVQRLAEAAEHEGAAYYRSLLSKTEIYATHALMPNGLYPPISDTTQRRVDNAGVLGVFSSPEFLYAASSGKKGLAPEERTLVLPDSGYAIYRSAWGDVNAAYLFFSAAYNADYHKHSDDLSIYLRSGNIDLLTESGPYSYDYKDPFSRYAYSQFSHNSLIVDDKSLPRTDNKADSVTLSVKEQTSNRVSVEGTNARYEDTRHVRRVEIDDSSGTPRINLTDRINSSEPHEYKLLWHLGADVRPVVHGQGFELFYKNKKVMDLAFSADVPTEITVHKGRTKPRPMGWQFPKFGEAVATHTISIAFRGTDAEIGTAIRMADFSYADRGITSDNGWARYQGSVPVNYMYCPPKTQDIKKLVVVFSAIHQPGDFTYNYKSTVEETGTAALYILDDFGDQGAYYYSDHRSTSIFESVQSLILAVMNKYDIELSNVATAGSSKGGSAALIHGLALGVDRIIAGAPQTRIGSFLNGPHPNILRFMSGGVSEDDVAFLDGIIPALLHDANHKTKISVVVGEADHHLKGHVLPLLSDARTSDTEVSAVVLRGASHSEIGKVFSSYLRANLEQWLRGVEEPVLPYEIVADRGEGIVEVTVLSPTNSLHSYRLFSGSQLVESTKYSASRSVTFRALEPGTYRVRVYSRASSADEPTAFSTRAVKLYDSPAK
ncbi:heparinase II/III domain-containing protein [Arthrobacter caoxuetaonis]|uniref:heparinase II/III domain-containing protein n=1 Tax=Arthrobacter caoxuetaonis TaxID=2886935 RepID=UPI001D13E0FA|nr:heparinase II/III family protein [Arthrobacter caoxuetaonis]MCC3282475.1 heparinase II/III family protein [Arthrobacter caoxuetaonis]